MPSFPQTIHVMTFRCDVARAVEGASPDGVYAGEETWETHLEDVFCYYWLDARRTTGEHQQPQRLSETGYMWMIVPSSTDITSDDRITQIRRRNGEVMIDYDLDITSVQRELGHLLLMVQERR